MSNLKILLRSLYSTKSSIRTFLTVKAITLNSGVTFLLTSRKADTATKLHGRISDETLFGLLSFIDDPQLEMERIRQEQEGSIDLEALLRAMEKGDAE